VKNETDAKARRLAGIIKSYGQVTLAFSGGVDSSFLLFEAQRILGSGNVLAVTVSSALHPVTEIREAALIARHIGAEQLVLPLDLLAVAEVAENSADRCYHCKRVIFKALTAVADRYQLTTVVDGTNADDAGDHRPGLRALQEFAISSPLLEAGLGKAEIRQLAKEAGLPNWSKPAAPCLATRFSTGTRLTKRVLEKVTAAESTLRDLRLEGNLRVRVHGNLVRIEADPFVMGDLVEMREKITSRLKALGFKYITLDLEGYRTGSMQNLDLLTD